MLLVFLDMIADVFSNKKRNSQITELFTRRKNLKVSLAFITQSFFTEPKNIRFNSTHYFTMKILNKRGHKQIAFNNSSEITLKTL